MTRLLAYVAISAMLTLASLALAWDHLVASEWFGALVMATAATAAYLICHNPEKYPEAGSPSTGKFIGVVAVLFALIAGVAQWTSPAVLIGLALASCAEELAFRYFPWRMRKHLRPRHRWMIPAAATVGFCLAHPISNPWLVADRALFSLAAFAICALTGSWIASAATHLIANLMVISLSETASELLVGPVILGMDIALVLAVSWLLLLGNAKRPSLTSYVGRITI